MARGTKSLMAALLTLAVPFAAGCIDSNLGPGNDTPDSATPIVTDDAGNVITPDAAITDPALIAKQLFDDTVRPIFVASCTACHATPTGGVGPGFLAPDMYASIKSYAGVSFFKPKDPQASRLLTYAQQGTGHAGTALTAAQVPVVRAWIEAEPLAAPSGDGGVIQNPTTTPMTPVVGLNTIDLSPLGAQLTGAQLTFMYERLTSGVYLTQISLKAGPNGLHAFHPLFSVWAPAQQPDTVDTFYKLDLLVAPNTTKLIGGGTVFMAAGMNAQISINFVTLDPSPGAGADAGVLAGGCKNVASFTANARGPLSTSCASCHAGANAGASNAFDLRLINDMAAASQATACAQTRGKINLANIANSILFQRVTPPQATNHPFTFQAAQATTFRNAVTIWATLEP